ncbi:unnamed protein product [Cladocopium goreaui]|uniref:Sushi, von Willebrand factor type A, EGF and pentraxin domain-containing protein 1 n=1 Tax=Cladocopium goreaui TaxID=2562237 RepID=A0A9P1DVM3_9DINO|nr:unnamed protein product [Cladocopium goreaui]
MHGPCFMEVYTLLVLLLVQAHAAGFDNLRGERRLQDTMDNASMQPVCTPKPAVSFVDQKPMCQPCASITINDQVKRCMFNTSLCDAVGPGETCMIDCAAPFVRVGNWTTGQCPKGNSIPDRMVMWSEPTCICPEPDAQQGYAQDSSGRWHCTQGFAGVPEVVCEPLPGCAGVQTFLRGCDKLVPCAMPSVDNCRFDVSRCTQVPPGGSCEIHCQTPLTGNHTVAVCKDLNTDPLQELDYFPLTCLLESCPDPSPWPIGYNKTADGKWVCATGYNGTARNRCELGDTWTSDCSAAAALTGCLQVVPCLAPTLTGLDGCTYDVSACTSVNPGEQCEVHCKSPFTGAKTEAYCPDGNTDPNGLVWTRPPCGLDSCDEPGQVPAGYQRFGTTGWECAQSYTGFAEKVCETTESCEIRAVLQGCLQLVPCEAQDTDCRYDFSDCMSVQPNSQCTVTCKAQNGFAGSSTTGTCLQGNTDVNGLVYTNPVCVINSCSDPANGNGYVKVEDHWECADGYSGRVNKTCMWMEDECVAEPLLSGCVMEQPCRLPDLGPVPCMYDVSDCTAVPPGQVCSVRCQSPYLGPTSDFACPVANTDPNRTLLGVLPVCGCGEPTPLPPGYNLTQDPFDDNKITYSCAEGYGGFARKLCQPGPDCTVDPLMTGCAIPLSCEAIFVDDSSGNGLARGAIHLGPALVGASVNESDVLYYEVFWADSCEDRMGSTALGQAQAGMGDACCRSDVYSVPIDSRPPEGATGWVVYSALRGGRAPVGVFVPLNQTMLNAIVIGNNAHFSQTVWIVFWLAVAIIGF